MAVTRLTTTVATLNRRLTLSGQRWSVLDSGCAAQSALVTYQKCFCLGLGADTCAWYCSQTPTTLKSADDFHCITTVEASFLDLVHADGCKECPPVDSP